MTAPVEPVELLRDARRDAIALARAAWRDDLEGVAAIWKNAPSREALLVALARLPAVLMMAAAERDGRTLDPDVVLGDLLRSLPLPGDNTAAHGGDSA